MAFPVTFSLPSTRWAFLPTTLWVEDSLIFSVVVPMSRQLIEGILLSDFRAIFLGKIQITERTVEIHTGSEHVWIDDKYFFACWTSDFYGLTHDLPHSILDSKVWLFELPLR